MAAPDFSGALWIKSSRSAENNNCVEMATSNGWTGIRDSKAGNAAHLIISGHGAASFVAHVKLGAR